MSIDRRDCLKWLLASPWLAAGGLAHAEAQGLARVREKGRLRIAVYSDFAPYSTAAGKGIDADIGRLLAEKLGVTAEVFAFKAGENMNDDLRNMVWRGHYLGTQPADVMMHVPVDPQLMKENDKVKIFGAYHQERLAVARDVSRVGAMSGSAAVALEVFTREKIGVEGATFADSFVMSVMNGRLRENVVHYRSVAEAAKALQEGAVAAILGPRAEVEGALVGETRFPIETPNFAELRFKGWNLGMAVKREEEDLANALATALEGLIRDGSIAAVFKRYGVSYVPV